MVQHEAVVIRLGERGSLLADVARLFGGIRDCSGQNNLRVLLQRYWLTMHGGRWASSARLTAHAALSNKRSMTTAWPRIS
jgi:hypothetical protein